MADRQTEKQSNCQMFCSRVVKKLCSSCGNCKALRCHKTAEAKLATSTKQVNANKRKQTAALADANQQQKQQQNQLRLQS